MPNLEDYSIHAWIQNNHFLNELGKQIEFNQHFFLFDPYRDWTPKQAIIKCSQVGFSLMMILKVLYAAQKKRYNIIYTLPTVRDVQEFVPSKVDQFIANNPSLQGIVGVKDNYSQKMIGDRFIYFKGTFSGTSKDKKGESATGIMLTADILAHDESDRSDQKVIEQYSSRLDYSEYKGQWYFSNPSIPNIGAHKQFLLSDQKHYFITCKRCNHKQYMTFEGSIDQERRIFVCQKCNKELGSEDRRKGQWVKKWRDKEISGYWINQLMAPWKTADEILSAYETKSKEFFYNFVLGQPYLSSEAKIDRELITKNIIEKYPEDIDKKHVIIGVDQGLKKHYVVGNMTEIFRVGVTEDWDDIEKMIKQYNAIAVIDALPDLTIPRKLMKKYQGRVYLCVYKRDKTEKKIVTFGIQDKAGFVYADRNASLQQMVDALVEGEIHYTVDVEGLEQYIEQWQTVYRRVEEDSQGIPRQIWDTVNGNDHFFHAQNYWWIGRQRGQLFEKYKPIVPSVIDKKNNDVEHDDSFKQSIKGVSYE